MENISVRCRETLAVQYFEFTEHVDEATEYREHFCSIAMRATELHADSLVQMSDHTTTFIHSFPPTLISVCFAILDGRIKEANR